MRKASDFQNTSDQFFTRVGERGLMYRAAEDHSVHGRTITLGGREVVQFGSGSYLGLETDERLRAGAIDAIARYGTQFPSSRAYVSAPLYPELEDLLSDIFGQPTLATASSTLAHTSAIPVLVDEDDAVLMDQQVHMTVQMAVNHVRVLGVKVELLRHNRQDVLEQRIQELAKTHRRIWYMADGVYSMFGDRAPLDVLKGLLDRHEALHLYIDDAHGMSWTGTHGKGHALSVVPHHPRMVVATSLAKSFASGGGALVLPHAEWRRKVRTIGPSLVFSGPLQPANLGAAIASARIHLTDEIRTLQDGLAARIAYCNRRCLELGLPLVSFDEVPIRFIGTGLSRVAIALGERLLEDGFFSNVAVFPAVPMQRAGLRFTITLHQSLDDIERFLSAVAHHLPIELAREGSSIEEVRKTFRLVAPTLDEAPGEAVLELTHVVPESMLTLERASTIEAFDAQTWDGWLGGQGAFTWEGLRFLERLYASQAAEENNWRFHYYVVRDQGGHVVLATFFTEALWKDDMFAPEAVSVALETERAAQPDLLVSRTFAMGTLLTEGQHLYLDRQADWRGAMALLLRAVRHDQALCGATQLVVRDVLDTDGELDTLLQEEGFAQVTLPENLVQELDWETEEGYLAALSQKSRRHLKRDVLPWDDAYEMALLDATTPRPDAATLNHLYALYRNVKDRNLRMNTFELPRNVFAAMLDAPQWELLVLRPKGSDAIVGFAACLRGEAQYVPLLVGMDYAYVESSGLYRQLLRRIVGRAHALGKRRICHGFGAALEKTRFGARVRGLRAYFQNSDTYRLELLGQLLMDVRREASALKG